MPTFYSDTKLFMVLYSKANSDFEILNEIIVILQMNIKTGMLGKTSCTYTHILIEIASKLAVKTGNEFLGYIVL